MNELNRCLFCYQELYGKNNWYHNACSKKIFETAQAPKIPYGLSDITQLAKKIIRSHITVTGVQTKLSLNLEKYRKKGGRFTIVGLWGNYILKPPVTKYPEMPEIEDLTMHLASIFEIRTVDHSLIPLKSGELAYITRRIDRATDVQRLHMEDMCQLTERLTEDKYKGSMEQVAKTIQKYSSNPLHDTLRFLEIALFSYLTGNADMHLKNFSLIYPLDGMIQLSPAYDMLSTRLLISEKVDPEEMALPLNGKKRNIQLKDFEKFSQTLGLTSRQYHNILDRFCRNFNKTFNFVDESFLTENKKTKFKKLLSNRAYHLELI